MELSLKPTSAKVKDYYNALNQFGQLNISHETAVRQAFASLLDTCAKQFKWKLVQEFRLPAPKDKSVIVDGAVLDSFTLKHGFWEAKDSKDDLEKEIKKKLEQGYPRDNIIFQSPEKAILYQNGVRQGVDADITNPDNLVELLKRFFSYTKPELEKWKRAVEEFAPHIPDIANKVKEVLDKERKKNREFVAAFDGFVLLCRQAINPDLSDDAVETMLIQHLLTERIFRKVFDNPEFTRRNIIAVEIEKVIKTITDKRFSRDEFLKDLDYFYRAIEENARITTDYSEKQTFLNTVYERFFQGFSPKEADTHGIVYTPQPIVNFMVRSVEEILKKEFGKSLGDREVHILDPFVGTGNFIVRVMQEIPKTRLQYKYENELHCNEVMLLPYYIASMNIEHAYLDATGEYKPFEGICLVDTFELAEASQSSLFTAENTARVERQKKSPIFVIVGNPPYNAWQEVENENNNTRRYKVLDKRVADTYSKSSKATNKNALADVYVKALRWASDRVRAQGIVAFISNNSFLEKASFDGVRKYLAEEFDQVYVLNLQGDIRKDSMRDGIPLGEEHTVFGLAAMVGISVSFFVKGGKGKRGVFYADVDFRSTRAQKFSALEKWGSQSGVSWRQIEPDADCNWLNQGIESDYKKMIGLAPPEIFSTISNGVKTNRDAWAYNFRAQLLSTNIQRTLAFYNAELHRFYDSKLPGEAVDSFLQAESSRIAWTETLKKDLLRGKRAAFDSSRIRLALYRPFTHTYLYFDRMLNERVYGQPELFPQNAENVAISITDIASRSPFSVMATKIVPDIHLCASTDTFQCFPFYTYDEDGTNRRENITDWALEEFRETYGDYQLTKWDIFYYTYAVLHHREYRTRYAANLKRELPRIPFAPAFPAFVKAGKSLAELHVDYEKQKEYPLERREKSGEKLNLRVEKMRLSKDKRTLVYNDFLTLTGIPKETYDYRLGNRSALEWVIDQYQVSTDKRSGITNDPNRDDDKEYILRLIGQVITVSLETVEIVNALPDLGLAKIDAAEAAKAVQ
jgi:predicted helicase